jgi:hypothetical protein
LGVFILLLRRGWHDSTLVCFTEFIYHTLNGLSSAVVLFLCRGWRDSILARCKEFIHPTLKELLRVFILSHRLSVTDDLALSAKRLCYAVDNQSARANHGGGSLTVPYCNNFPSIRLYTATRVAVHPLSYVISFFSQASCCNYSCALTAKEPPPRPAPKPYPTSTNLRSNSEPNKPPPRPPPKAYATITTQSDGSEHNKQPSLPAPMLHPTSIYQDSNITSYKGRTDVGPFPIEHTHRVPHDEQPSVCSVMSDITLFDAGGILQKRYVFHISVGRQTPSVERSVNMLR